MATTPYDAGMREQIARFHTALGTGMKRLGWKVALGDPAVMERLRISDSVVAWLDGNRLLAPGATYQPPEGARTAVEAELAIRVGKDTAIVEVAPAIEFVDLSRPAGSLDVILAHAVFHDSVMFGPAIPLEEWGRIPWPPDGWPTILKDGAEAAIFAPHLSPGDLPGLARRKASQLMAAGESLEPGDWIITGSLTTPVAAGPGTRITIDYGPLGKLHTRIGSVR